MHDRDGHTAKTERQDFLDTGRLVAAERNRAPGCCRRCAGEHHIREITAATELLEVQTDAELQRFLVDLMRQAAGGRAGSRAGRALRGILTHAASRVLPTVAHPTGGGAPGTGTPTDPASLGLELEGLSSEDREFETARSFVRFVEAASRGVAAAPKEQPAADTARAAVISAAQRHLPGLLAPRPDNTRDRPPRAGSWVRHQGHIVIKGA